MKKRRKYLLIASIGVVGVLAVLLPNTYYSRSSGSCRKCFLGYSSWSIDVFEHRICGNKNTGPLRGTPALRDKQSTCLHSFCVGGSRKSLLGKRGENWDCFGQRSAMWARQADKPDGLYGIVRELEWLTDDDRRNSWAWFMQQATGVDFGATFDDEKAQPRVPPGTVEKILQWWNTEGITKYPTARQSTTRTATAPATPR